MCHTHTPLVSSHTPNQTTAWSNSEEGKGTRPTALSPPAPARRTTPSQKAMLLQQRTWSTKSGSGRGEESTTAVAEMATAWLQRESDRMTGSRIFRCQASAQAAMVHRPRNRLVPTIQLQVEPALGLFGTSPRKRKLLLLLLRLHHHPHAVIVLLLLKSMKEG